MNKYQEALDLLNGLKLPIKVLQELVDKSTPKKAIRKKLEDTTKTQKNSLVNLVGNRYYSCPNCGSYLGAFIDDYCKYCGQALDRSKEDE